MKILVDFCLHNYGNFREIFGSKDAEFEAVNPSKQKLRESIENSLRFISRVI